MTSGSEFRCLDDLAQLLEQYSVMAAQSPYRFDNNGSPDSLQVNKGGEGTFSGGLMDVVVVDRRRIRVVIPLQNSKSLRRSGTQRCRCETVYWIAGTSGVDSGTAPHEPVGYYPGMPLDAEIKRDM